MCVCIAPEGANIFAGDRQIPRRENNRVRPKSGREREIRRAFIVDILTRAPRSREVFHRAFYTVFRTVKSGNFNLSAPHEGGNCGENSSVEAATPAISQFALNCRRVSR